jgi:hypothetical protein
MDEDAGVLELRERQLRNVPEELGWWYRVDSNTVDDIAMDVHAGYRERSGTSAIGRHQ